MVLSAFPGLWWLFPWLYYFPSHVRNVFFYNLFQYLLRPFLFFWDLCNSNVGTCNIVSEVSEAVLISFHLFSFFSLSVISSYLSTSWLIHSSASVILLLIPSSVFFKPVAVLFSTVCLFFSFSLSLNLKHFLYFLDPWLFYFWDLESSLLLWFFFFQVVVYFFFIYLVLKVFLCSFISIIFIVISSSLIAQLVKNPPAMQETQIQFLCQENSL